MRSDVYKERKRERGREGQRERERDIIWIYFFLCFSFFHDKTEQFKEKPELQ